MNALLLQCVFSLFQSCVTPSPEPHPLLTVCVPHPPSFSLPPPLFAVLLPTPSPSPSLPPCLFSSFPSSSLHPFLSLAFTRPCLPLLFLSSRLSSPILLLASVSLFCREHELQSHTSRFRHFAAEVNRTLLLERVERDAAEDCGNFSHKVTATDKSLWNHIIQEILLVLLVLSAFPLLKNKRVLYI